MSAVTLSDRILVQVPMLVKLGVPPLTAAATEGVDEALFAEWMRRGRNPGRGEWRFKRFFESVVQAEAEFEAAIIGRVRASASDGNWQAAAWLAERRFPEKYLRKSVSGEKAREGVPPEGHGNAFADLDDVPDNVRPIRKS